MAPNISAATLKTDQWLQNSGAKIICSIDLETKANYWSSVKVELNMFQLCKALEISFGTL